MTYYEYETRFGVFRIAPFNGGWATYFEGERLDWYNTAERALQDLADGHGQWPAPDIDPSALGLPDCLSEWRLRRS